ncbi:hypothetical protein PR048_009757 [Dryococelus australis]|uniref:DDE Tnp4 domain-containing protein n=1 Tax=Dryococelus australis TaxID=614101 RepID=A0ABQ9I0U7_9NEOP|nr:hypothetical protein PR048_009757 [Dryococelus australis]
MAVVDAQYRLTYIDVGCNGRVGRLYTTHWNLGNYLCRRLNVCQEGVEKFPIFFFVADDAFAIRSYIMKPYPFRGLSFSESVFNYRVSRARRVKENSFGIVANKFLVLRKPILLELTKTERVVLAVCTLPNFLISRRGQRYIHAGSVYTGRTGGSIIPGEWHQEGNPESTWHLLQQTSRRQGGQSDRDELQMYLMSRQLLNMTSHNTGLSSYIVISFTTSSRDHFLEFPAIARDNRLSTIFEYSGLPGRSSVQLRVVDSSSPRVRVHVSTTSVNSQRAAF